MASAPPDVTCTLASAGQPLAVQVRIHNPSDRTLHLPTTPRMPYLLEDSGELVILYGINPPDPNTNYPFIEMPVTRPLEPGASIEETVSLLPLQLGDHYNLPRQRNPVTEKHGPTPFRCRVGWGETPILPRKEEKQIRNIHQLLAWQQLTDSASLTVPFP